MYNKLDVPIIIPSYYRENSTLYKCLNSILKVYDVRSIYVILQKWPKDETENLKNTYPKTVNFIEKEEGFSNGIIGAFQFCHDYMSSRYPHYIFIEDDITMTKFKGNEYFPLYAIQETLKLNPEVGVVGVRFIGLQFKPNEKFIDSVKFSGNPAHCVGYSSAATKDIVLDPKFSNFRTDTDITLQIIQRGFGLVYFASKFTYYHNIPISKIKDNKFVLIEKNKSSTNNRTKNTQKETDTLLAEKYRMKINKKGRALTEYWIRDNNIFHPKNKTGKNIKLNTGNLEKLYYKDNE